MTENLKERALLKAVSNVTILEIDFNRMQKEYLQSSEDGNGSLSKEQLLSCLKSYERELDIWKLIARMLEDYKLDTNAN
jgi:hypothetical protein